MEGPFFKYSDIQIYQHIAISIPIYHISIYMIYIIYVPPGKVRWRNSHVLVVLVYHGPLKQIATFWEVFTPYTFTTV